MVSNGTYGCFRDDSKPDLRQSVAVCCRPASAIRPPSPGPVIRPAMQVRGPSWGCVKMCEDVWRCVKMCEDVWRCVKLKKRTTGTTRFFFCNCYIADIAEMIWDVFSRTTHLVIFGAILAKVNRIAPVKATQAPKPLQPLKAVEFPALWITICKDG